MKLELAKHLDKVRDTVTEVDRVVSSHKYPGDRRTVVVMGLLSTIIQHHRSMLQLIKSAGTAGSSWALARDILKGTRYGLWINSCATEDQILRIEEADEFPFSVPELTKEIEALTVPIAFLRTSRTAGERNSTNYLDPTSSNSAAGRLTEALDCTSTMEKFGRPRQSPPCALCC